MRARNMYVRKAQICSIYIEYISVHPDDNIRIVKLGRRIARNDDDKTIEGY